MGNALARKRTVKVMKIDGQILKFKTPLQVSDIIKDHPDHVLMDSEAVRHLGVRAKALALDHELKPKRLYFLVQLPKVTNEMAPRRVRSGVLKMSAKERLESLMLSRRSVSDLTHLKMVEPVGDELGGAEGGAVRVKMRLPKSQVIKLMEQSNDAGEAAENMVALCISDAGEGAAAEAEDNGSMIMEQRQWKPALGSIQEIQKTEQKLGDSFPKKLENWYNSPCTSQSRIYQTTSQA